tara:strand:+ start:15261 stop:16355 length:1095 start_codon:yes stop_codon:yes gene_type:complete
MRLNDYIHDVERMKIARKSKKQFTRLDCAERIFDYNEKLFQDFISTLTQEDFITYPSYAEYAVLEDKLAKYLGVNQNNVSLATGSDSCIKDLIQITCTEGSEILSVSPCFPMYFVYGFGFGAKFTGIDYLEFKEKGVDAYLDHINENTRLAIFTNPGSPYGEYTDPAEISRLCKRLEEKGVILLVDEAYVDFSPGGCIPLLEQHSNMIISRTFSKGWGAAGTRVGYFIANEDLIDLVSKVKLTYPISCTSMKFASFLLDNSSMVEKYCNDTVRDRNKLCDLLEGAGYDVVRAHTNTIHFHESDGDNSTTIDILDQHGISFKCGGRKTGTAVKVPGDMRTSWIRLSVGPDIHETKFIKQILEGKK